jgi:hypothetical protein
MDDQPRTRGEAEGEKINRIGSVYWVEQRQGAADDNTLQNEALLQLSSRMWRVQRRGMNKCLSKVKGFSQKKNNRSGNRPFRRKKKEKETFA